MLDMLDEISKNLGEIAKESEKAILEIGKTVFFKEQPEQAQQKDTPAEPLSREERESQERREWAEKQWAAIMKNREKERDQEHDLDR